MGEIINIGHIKVKSDTELDKFKKFLFDNEYLYDIVNDNGDYIINIYKSIVTEKDEKEFKNEQILSKEIVKCPYCNKIHLLDDIKSDLVYKSTDIYGYMHFACNKCGGDIVLKKE